MPRVSFLTFFGAPSRVILVGDLKGVLDPNLDRRGASKNSKILDAEYVCESTEQFDLIDK